MSTGKDADSQSGVTEFFTLGEDLYEHRTGDARCHEGWCGAHRYPRRCENGGCPGLVHADFGDENADGDFWLYTKCDVCGEPE